MMIEVSADDGVIKVTCSKAKDSAPFEARHYRLVEVQLEDDKTSCVVLPSDRVIPDKMALTDAQKTIIEWLASEVFDQGARAVDLKRAVQLTESQFYRALKALSRRGLIEKDGRFDPWQLTDAGKAEARRLNFTTGTVSGSKRETSANGNQPATVTDEDIPF